MEIFNRLKLLSLALMLCVTTQLQAADVDLAAAQNAAKAFLTKQVAGGRLKAPAATNLKLVKAEASVAKPTAVDYYIFNSDKSYVVIAGDDLAPQILMYGEEGSLDINNIPPAMQWLLNKYKYQIDGIKAGTLEPVKVPRRATVAVAPMVTANWDQTAPYYNHTPTSGGTHAYTGCPATSLSMCFYKWKWPETYPALSALSVSGGLSCPALSAKAADWANIIDEYTGPTNYEYTSAQADAVSWLMRYVGQACNMQYTTSGSGATDPEIHQACLTFGYTDAQLLTLTEIVSSGWGGYSNSAQNYTDDEWNSYMMNELQNGRPIEYLACDVSGTSVSGHAFNVFGCNSSGQYYVNWGWSGDSNGYCTLHNFTTAVGSVGQTGSYVFNYGEAMIIGIEPPAGVLENPRIKASSTTLDMSAVVGTPATATFTVTGYNLTEGVSLSLSGDNAFSLSTNSISVNEAENGATVTVTYNPAAAGTHDATVTLTSADAENVSVKLNGTATLRKEAVVLQEAANVASTSFKAVWTDETPAANVASYTLWVNVEKPNDVKLLGSIDGSNYTGSYTDITLSSPWGGTNVKGGNNAVYISNSYSTGNITFTIPQGYNNGTFTVRVTTVSGTYGSGNITVKSAQTAAVGHNFSAGGTHTWLVTAKSGETITITSTDSSYSPDMAMIEVYSGDLTQQAGAPARIAEEGDESYRVITGITGKEYTVDGLTPEATYYFRVKALYTDGTESNWTATKQVTLLADTSTPKISVTKKNLEFNDVTVGETATQTIQVSGVNLEGVVMLTLNDENGVFHLSNTTVSMSDAAAGKDVTVTFTPAANVDYEATVTLASTNAQSVTVTLTGNGAYVAPVMQAVDTTKVKNTSFRADWTDETAADNVDSYTLMVSYVSPVTEPEPVEEADLSTLEAVTNSEGYLANVASSASQYLPDGWTVSNYLYVADSCILIREASPLKSAAFNLPDGMDKVTVVVDCEAYQANSTDIATGITVASVKGGDSETQMITNDRATYTFVLDAQAANEQITFNPYTTSSRYYAYNVIYSIKIYAGDITAAANAPMYAASETGDSTYRVIEGITDKYYVVNGLIGGGTYTYKVKTVYANQSESEWSNEETVTLKDTPDEPVGLIGDLNRDGVVDISDVNICINIVLEFNNDPEVKALADLTGDGAVDISDVNALINIVLEQ